MTIDAHIFIYTINILELNLCLHRYIKKLLGNGITSIYFTVYIKNEGCMNDIAFYTT